MTIRFFYILFPIIFLTACSGIKPIKERIQDNISCQTVPASTVPDWVFGNTENNIDSYYGIGVSEGFNITFNEMKKLSRANAEMELSSSIEVRITSSLNKDVREELTSKSNNYKRTVDQVVRSNTDILLTDIQLDNSWFNHETCQLWTRVKLTKESLQASQKQMKSMIMLKLDKTSKNIDSIKMTIENDPNVVLRKYGLTINSMNYVRAFNLPIPDEELFPILDLYAKYGSTPNNHASTLGAWSVEPFSSALMIDIENPSTSSIIIANNPSLLQSVFRFNHSNKTIERLTKYFLTLNTKEVPTRVIHIKSHEEWFYSYKEVLHNQSNELYKQNRKNIKNLKNEFNKNISSQEYSKRKIHLEKEYNKEKKIIEMKKKQLIKDYGSSMSNFSDYFFSIHYAACFGNKESLLILDQYNLSMTKKTKKGYSPLEIANICKNDSAIKYLN